MQIFFNKNLTSKKKTLEIIYIHIFYYVLSYLLYIPYQSIGQHLKGILIKFPPLINEKMNHTCVCIYTSLYLFSSGIENFPFLLNNSHPNFKKSKFKRGTAVMILTSRERKKLYVVFLDFPFSRDIVFFFKIQIYCLERK